MASYSGSKGQSEEAAHFCCTVMARSNWHRNCRNCLADQKQIPYQFKEKISGGNDATRIAKAEKGIFVGSVSVPVRYIHSPASVMHPEDYANTQKLAMGVFTNSHIFFNQ